MSASPHGSGAVGRLVGRPRADGLAANSSGATSATASANCQRCPARSSRVQSRSPYSRSTGASSTTAPWSRARANGVIDTGHPDADNVRNPLRFRCAPVPADIGDDHSTVVADGQLGPVAVSNSVRSTNRRRRSGSSQQPARRGKRVSARPWTEVPNGCLSQKLPSRARPASDRQLTRPQAHEPSRQRTGASSARHRVSTATESRWPRRSAPGSGAMTADRRATGS